MSYKGSIIFLCSEKGYTIFIANIINMDNQKVQIVPGNKSSCETEQSSLLNTATVIINKMMLKYLAKSATTLCTMYLVECIRHTLVESTFREGNDKKERISMKKSEKRPDTFHEQVSKLFNHSIFVAS